MEIWKDVKGFEGSYQINNFGIVRSLSRIRIVSPRGYKQSMLKKGQILKPSLDRYGYPQINLSSPQSKPTTYKIHRLVAEAFIPNAENKPCINHINGIKTDNKVNNLEWVTHSENNKHAYNIGLSDAKGVKSGRAKLTNEKVYAIKYKMIGFTNKKLGEIFCIDNSHIGAIKNGKAWPHIKKDFYSPSSSISN